MSISVNSAYAALGRFVVRFAWPIVGFWIAVVAVTSAAFPSLSSEVNGNNSAFLKSSEPSVRAANLAAPLTGQGSGIKTFTIQIVGARVGSALTAADLAAMNRVAGLVRAVGGVRSARLIGVSADRQVAEVLVRATASQSDIAKDKTLIDAITATFARASTPPGLQVHTAGQIATAVANQANSSKQGNQTQLFSILFVVALLLVVFRSLQAALATLLPSVIALLISQRVIGELGKQGLQISDITQILLIVLLIGAGTDYGLFLIFRFRENLRDGIEPPAAVSRAVVNVGESITGSAGTVILALLTLVAASFGLYHDLGVPLALGVAVMLLVGLTLQPALLAILGRRAFWPVKIGTGVQREGVWGKVARTLVSRPAVTLAAGLVVFGALAVGALGYKAGGFGGDTSAPAGSDAAKGNAILAAHFPRSAYNPANIVFAYPGSVWEHPRPMLIAEASLRASGVFNQIATPFDPNGTPITPAQLTALYRRLGPPQRLPVAPPPGLRIPPALYDAYRLDGQQISADGRVVLFNASLVAGPQSSTQALNASPQIRRVVARAARASGARDSGLAGEAAAVYDINHAANRDLAKIIPIAIIAIGLLLALVLRSVVAPLYLIVSVAISYLAALGLATLVFIDLGGYGGITFVLPFLMFVFLLALGEDYNILVMTRIREEAHHLPLREAVVKAISRTGSTVTSAGLILGGTFAVFAIVSGGSGGSSFQPIGFGLAFGILMDTFLVRTLLVPSTVMLLGRWNWWPSRLEPELPAVESEPVAGPV
jgi:RND superfamily putative drug exporter